MSMNPKKSPVLFMFVSAGCFLLVLSVFPIWGSIRIENMEEKYGPAGKKMVSVIPRTFVPETGRYDYSTKSNLWKAAMSLSASKDDPNFPEELRAELIRDLPLRNLPRLTIVIALGVVFGRLVYWLVWGRNRMMDR